jgi:hypothetical protein
MVRRPDRDTVLIESSQGGDFSVVVDRATCYEIITDLRSPSLARFEIGDEGTWSVLRDAIAIGAEFVVSVNDRPRLKGRLLSRSLAVTVDGGATVQVVVRTKLADALFSACDPKIGVKNTTLKDTVLAAFRKMGLVEADFVFQGDVARDILTGRGQNSPAPPELSALKEDEARPHPPESVYAFADRHLARFGLMIWDAPDGRIVVGTPDDTQPPTYQMTARRGDAARTNNLLSATKSEDFEDVPASLWVYGVGGGKDQAKSRVKFVRTDPVLSAVRPTLVRDAVVIDEGIKTQAQAEARARRELMNRSLAKDSWVLETDGFSYWSGSDAIPYAVDTVADVRVDVAGAAVGPYLIWQVAMRGDAEQGHTTQLSAVAKGVWAL